MQPDGKRTLPAPSERRVRPGQGQAIASGLDAQLPADNDDQEDGDDGAAGVMSPVA